MMIQFIKESPMDSNQKLVQTFINDQRKLWKNISTQEKKRSEIHLPVITVCMEAGSGGSLVAHRIAEGLGFDLFHREIIQAIAKIGEISPARLESMEKARYTGVQDFIASLLDEKYLWPGVYLDHLKKVVKAIGTRGGAVIVGRGANFVLLPAKVLSIRVVAPLERRIQNVAHAFGVSDEDARQRILHRDSRRAAFVKKSFDANIKASNHYDMILNTGKMSIEEAAEAVSTFWCKRYLMP
jgi:cytidylate kinase